MTHRALLIVALLPPSLLPSFPLSHCCSFDFVFSFLVSAPLRSLTHSPLFPFFSFLFHRYYYYCMALSSLAFTSHFGIGLCSLTTTPLRACTQTVHHTIHPVRRVQKKTNRHAFVSALFLAHAPMLAWSLSDTLSILAVLHIAAVLQLCTCCILHVASLLAYCICALSSPSYPPNPPTSLAHGKKGNSIFFCRPLFFLLSLLFLCSFTFFLSFLPRPTLPTFSSLQ